MVGFKIPMSPHIIDSGESLVKKEENGRMKNHIVPIRQIFASIPLFLELYHHKKEEN